MILSQLSSKEKSSPGHNGALNTTKKPGATSPDCTVLENYRKSLIQHCERSELRIHFEWRQRKMVHFDEILKTWSLQSNSVTRKISFNRTKNRWKMKNSNAIFWAIFKQCGNLTMQKKKNVFNLFYSVKVIVEFFCFATISLIFSSNSGFSNSNKVLWNTKWLNWVISSISSAQEMLPVSSVSISKRRDWILNGFKIQRTSASSISAQHSSFLPTIDLKFCESFSPRRPTKEWTWKSKVDKVS